MSKQDCEPDKSTEQGGWCILYAGPASGAMEQTYRNIIEIYGDPFRYEDPAIDALRVAFVKQAQDGLDRLLGTQSTQQKPTPGNR